MVKDSKCFGNFFLVLVLIVFFMLVYVYVGDVQKNKLVAAKEFFSPFDKNTLLPMDKVVYIQGNGVPDKPPSGKIEFDLEDPSTTSVDGTEKTPKSMFMFAYNKCDPKCCGQSSYSCNGGCVCPTKEQMRFVSNRGYNNKFDKCSYDEY